MANKKNYNWIFIFLYCTLFTAGIKTLFHGFPDIERFFAEWMDERITLTAIMRFGTLDFAPTLIMHPPLYHYLTFIPVAGFFAAGKLIGLFYDKIDFVRFYFSNTHYFFFIGRMMSYIFYWLTAVTIFKILRLFCSKIVSHIAVLSFLLIPRLIFDFSTTRPETLLFLNTSIFFYFFLKHYLDKRKMKYLFFAAFLLGVSSATKYNALYLGVMFIPLLFLGRKNYKGFLLLWPKICFFVFLGFFVCNPFFIIQFNKYLTCLMIYGIEMKEYWKGFSSSHIVELGSLMYINVLGLLVLIFGLWNLFRKDKKLFIIISSAILVYEVYFGIFFRNFSPLRYLNPLLPAALLIFGFGIDFILRRKRLIFIIALFILIASYNYIDIWTGLSFGPTHIQRARAFIEETIPEFTNICIMSTNYIPQLNMTEESYNRLVETIPRKDPIRGHVVDSGDMGSDIFRALRIESLMKKPQYNIIEWNGNIDTGKEAIDFFKKNNIEYVISKDRVIFDDKDLEDTGIAILGKEFKPRNKRIYEAVFADVSLYLYKIN